MRKRFFQPIWKFEEIENQLKVLEENGWRLNKIGGFRCFEFVKSTPKTVQYFFTYTMTRERLSMNLIEDTLIRRFNANRIKGCFNDCLGGTEVFRIVKSDDLQEQKANRDIILQNYLLRRFIFGIAMLVVLFAPLVIGAPVNMEKFLEGLNVFYIVFLCFCFLSVVGYAVYNLIGLLYQNNKIKNK